MNRPHEDAGIRTTPSGSRSRDDTKPPALLTDFSQEFGLVVCRRLMQMIVGFDHMDRGIQPVLHCARRCSRPMHKTARCEERSVGHTEVSCSGRQSGRGGRVSSVSLARTFRRTSQQTDCNWQNAFTCVGEIDVKSNDAANDICATRSPYTTNRNLLQRSTSSQTPNWIRIVGLRCGTRLAQKPCHRAQNMQNMRSEALLIASRYSSQTQEI